MSEETYEGLFTTNEETQISKFADGLFDFNELFGKLNIKALGINISGWMGRKLEKKDRDIFLSAVQWLDNKIIAGKLSAGTQSVLKELKGYIVSKDSEGFIGYVSEYVPAKISVLPTDSAEEILVKSALTGIYALVKQYLEKAETFVEKTIEEAEAEDA